MFEYKTIYTLKSVESLDIEVSEHLNSGWELLGNQYAVVLQPEQTIVLFQAMIKES